MAGNITLKTGTTVVLMDSASAALANNAIIACTASSVQSVFDNSSQLMEACSIEVISGFTLSPSASSEIQLYLVPALDGTNYGTVDLTTPTTSPTTYAQSVFTTVVQTGTQRMTAEAIPLSPCKYQAYVINKTGQIMSAGFLVNIYPFGHQYT